MVEDVTPLHRPRPVPLSFRDLDEQRTALKVPCPWEPCGAEIGEPCSFKTIHGDRAATRLQHAGRVARARREGGE